MFSADRTLPAFSKRHCRQSTRETVHTLNATIDRLRDDILPKQPYLLSVPSDVPYRHSSRFVNTWHVGTPFGRREEQLQYLSFLPHQDEEEELLRVEGGWWDDAGPNIRDNLSPKTGPNSGNNTPVDSSQRKKISLKDYKTKDKPCSPVCADGVGSEHNAHEKQGARPTTKESAVDSLKTKPEPVTRPEMTEHVEPLSTMGPPPPQFDGTNSPKPAVNDSKPGDSPRPHKRRKLSPSPEITFKVTAGSDETSDFPRLLSPTLPSTKRNTSLPELLSPLLPPTLAKAIATPPKSPSHERTNPHQRSDSVRSILAGAIGEGSPRPSEKNGTSTGSLGVNRVRSNSQHSAKSNGSSTTPNKALAPVKANAPSSTPGTPLLSAKRSPGPRQRHIIALKYGKKNRKRIESLLKFASRPKKPVVKRENDEAPPKPQFRAHEAAKESSKPKIASDNGPDRAPRTKLVNSTVDAVKRPSTPVPAKAKDGGGLSPSIIKSAYNTPKKEFKSTAMRRVESTDADPATPGDRGRVSTPLANDRGSIAPKPSPAPSSTPSTKEEDRHGWIQLKDKYFQLGRTIKHDGQAMSEQDPDPSKSVALLVEALLCFMMNLATQASVRPNVDPGWRSILPYHIFLYRVSRKVPLLHGLVVQLGAVCRQIIHSHEIERLSRDPLPDDHLGSAPTPGSDGNTKTNEDAEKYKKKYVTFRDELIHNARELQTAWMDGTRLMSPELLSRDFPKAWAGRLKDYRNRGSEKPTPTKMAIGYYLPLDPASTAFEAVQFALAVLGEWANSEEVDWIARLEM